jgi:hypothetical protein
MFQNEFAVGFVFGSASHQLIIVVEERIMYFPFFTRH